MVTDALALIAAAKLIASIATCIFFMFSFIGLLPRKATSGSTSKPQPIPSREQSGFLKLTHLNTLCRTFGIHLSHPGTSLVTSRTWICVIRDWNFRTPANRFRNRRSPVRPHFPSPARNLGISACGGGLVSAVYDRCKRFSPRGVKEWAVCRPKTRVVQPQRRHSLVTIPKSVRPVFATGLIRQ